MLKKSVWLAVLLFVSSWSTQAAWRNDEITMLVMPREEIPLRIAQDISRRYPTLIISYHLMQGKLKLNAWNGESWIPVPIKEYTAGTFFANRPTTAIVVESESFRLPSDLTPNGIWCESASLIASTKPRVLLHLLGLHFDFPFRHWKQFAERYGYAIEEINPTLQNVHWWNLRADQFLEKRDKRDFSVDLNKWYDLAPIAPPTLDSEPVESEMPATPVVPAGATDVDITAKPVEPTEGKSPWEPPAPILQPAPAVESAPAPSVEADPFSSDEIPAAEIVIPSESRNTGWKIL